MCRNDLFQMENRIIFHFFSADAVILNYHFMEASLENAVFYREVKYKGTIQGQIQNVQHSPWSCANHIS